MVVHSQKRRVILNLVALFLAFSSWAIALSFIFNAKIPFLFINLNFTPYTAVWWSIFLAVWTTILAASVIIPKHDPAPCSIGSYFNVIVVAVALLASVVHLAGAASMLLPKYGTDDAGFIAVFSMLISTSVVGLSVQRHRRTRERAHKSYASVREDPEEDSEPPNVKIRSWMIRNRCQIGSRLMRVLKVLFVVFLALLLVTVLTIQCFAAYQVVSTAIDATIRAPPTGRLYPIHHGNLKLHATCYSLNSNGSSNATILFESGMGCMSIYWSLIITQLQNMSATIPAARACTYDRAGYGWSQRGVLPRTSAQIVEELHQLLSNANLKPPFILVGHSFGAMNVRLFAATFPRLVSGLILLDSSFEFQTTQIFAAKNLTFPSSNPMEWEAVQRTNVDRMMAPLGFWRIQQMNSPTWSQLSAPDQFLDRAWSSTSSTPDAVWSEEIYFNTNSSEQVAKSRFKIREDLPVAVLTGGLGINGTCDQMGYQHSSKECREWLKDISVSGPLWLQFQSQLAKLTSRTSWKILWDSGHFIHLEYPKIVVETIIGIAEKAAEDQSHFAPQGEQTAL